MNKVLLWIVIVAVVIVVLFIVFSKSGSVSISPSDQSQAANVNSALTTGGSPGPTTASSSMPTKAASKPTSPASTLSYTQAMAKYGGYRIQFDANCQANPNQLAVKNGNSIMLDNRVAEARKFRAGGNTYTIRGYGFMILPMKAPVAALPAAVTIGCGNANNVATIHIEK